MSKYILGALYYVELEHKGKMIKYDDSGNYLEKGKFRNDKNMNKLLLIKNYRYLIF